MKRFKKYLALMLAACMICSSVGPAYADVIKEKDIAIGQSEDASEIKNEIPEEIKNEATEEIKNETAEEFNSEATEGIEREVAEETGNGAEEESEREVPEEIENETPGEIKSEATEEITGETDPDEAGEDEAAPKSLMAVVANKENVMELTGKISGDRTVPEDVKQLILAGASGKDARIIIKGETEIVIENGTPSELDIIEADKTIRFSGSGNLKLSFGIVGKADIIFNHTGQIDVADGTVFSLKGDIVFNSGIVNINAAETAAAAVMAVCGKVAQNGGTLKIDENGKTGKTGKTGKSDIAMLKRSGQLNYQILDSSDVNLGGPVNDSVDQSNDALSINRPEQDYDLTDLEDGRWINIIDDVSGVSGDSATNHFYPLYDGESDASNDTQITKDEFGEVITGKFTFYNYYPITTDFIYRDSVFANPSNIYDQKLALMSLNLAVSGFSDLDHKPEGASNYLKEMFRKTGFSDIYVNEAYITPPDANTIGVGIAHREIEGQSVVAIVLRGGGYDREGSGNLNVGLKAEHAGWATARNIVIDELLKYMNEHAGVISANPKFWIVGYSRSAATANLGVNFMDCAIDINNGKASVESLVPESERSDKEKELLAGLSNLLKEKDVDYEDIYCYTFGTPMGAAGDDEDGSGYPNHDDPDTNNIWSLTNLEDPVPYVVPTYKLDFYRYGAATDPRFMSIPEEYSSENIEKPGEDVEGLMLEQLKVIDPEMYKKVADAPQFALRTTTIPDLLTLKFGFTDDENHAEITYPVDSASLNDSVTDKEEYIGRLINRVVDEVAGGKETADEIRHEFYYRYQDAFETILYMVSDLTEKEKTQFLNALNKGLEKELDGRTLVALISSIVIVELLPEGDLRDIAREVPKGILSEMFRGIFSDAKETLKDKDKLCKYIDQINDSAEDMINLVYNLVLNDLHDNLLTTIGTALYYGKSLVYSHYPQVMMAYLRAHDSDYIGGGVDPDDPGEHGGYSGSSSGSSSGSGASPSFTYGRWTLDANGKDWNFYVKDSAGNENKFCGGWIYAYNPAARDYNHKVAWFYFDKTGKMLTGWQKLFWNNVENWYYLNPKNDETGTFGECQMGGKTDDGYTLNADGTWTGR